MNQDIIVETRFFFISFLSGFLLIIGYDFFRILRKIIKHKEIWVDLEDFFFWVFAGVYLFSVMYRYNNGIIRAFSILGILLGMLLYQSVFSKFVVHIVTKFIRLLFAPVRFILKQVKRVARLLIRKFKKVWTFLKKRMLKIKKWYTIKVDTRKKKHQQTKELKSVSQNKQRKKKRKAESS